jgi:WD40 repeat protein
VAVKLLHPAAGEGDRFRREAEAAARVNHPNAVQLYEVGTADGVPYLVLELVPGGTLRQRLADRPLAPRAAAELVATLAGAVQAAHACGVVHRDLKPANVLLAADGTPKVADFGLAAVAGSAAGPTASGQFLGTAAYMPPEQADGRPGWVGPAVDVYSLGAVLYECLTGRPPFLADNPLETLRQVHNDDPVPPRRLAPKVPRDLETVCLKCLSKEPARRYATAAALGDDLRRFLAGEPIRGRRVGPVERAAKWVRRRPGPAAAVGVLVAAVVAGAVLVTRHEARLRGLNAELSRSNADLARTADRAGRAGYAAQMGLARQAVEAGQLGRLADLLRAQEPAAPGWADFRGFEWYYLRHLRRAGRVTTLPPFDGLVWRAAYSPDGRTLAAVGRDGMLVLWDAAAGTVRASVRLRPPGPPANPLPSSLAFAPDGRVLATADGRLRLWDVVTGRELAGDAPPRPGRSADFSPDGRTLAVGRDDGTIDLLDPATRAPAGPPLGKHPDAVTAVAFSPDGRRLVTLGWEREQTAAVWDPAAGRRVDTIRPVEPGAWVNAVAFAPDGRRLAVTEGYRHVSAFGGRVRLLGADLTPDGAGWPVPPPGAWAVAFSPDGRHLAAGLGAGPVRVWDLATRQEAAELCGHVGRVLALAFSPDGRYLAAGSADGTAAVWDPAAGRADRVDWPGGGRRQFRSLAVAPAGGGFAVGGQDGRVRVFDPAAGRFHDFTVPGCEKGGTAVAFAPDGRWLASPHPDEAAEWRGRPGEEPATVVGLFDPADGRRLARLVGHADRVVGLAVRPDGRLLATGGHDKTVRLWDPDAGECVGVIDDLPDRVASLAFSPDGGTLAVGHGGGRVGLWAVPDRRLMAELPSARPGTAMAVAFSPDGRTLAAGHWSGRVELWDVAGRQLRAGWSAGGSVLALAFSPDGGTLATGDTAGAVRLYDPAGGQERFGLHAHKGWVQGLGFSPDGQELLSAGDDGVVRRWRAPRE